MAGIGGAARETDSPPPIPVSYGDPKILEVAQAIQDLSGESTMVRNHTRGLSMVLLPHLEGMARTPSVFPAKGFITSSFGSRQDPIDGMPAYHEGVDISASYGSTVVAPAEGIVVFTGWRTGLGNVVEISHGRGLVTRFGHLASIAVKPGQKVKRWQKIGAVGSTGRSTGSHLHYEIRLGEKPVNPMKFLAVGY